MIKCETIKFQNGNGGYSNADISAAALNVSNSLISSVQNHLNVADQSVSSINPALLHIFDSYVFATMFSLITINCGKFYLPFLYLNHLYQI